MRLLTEILSNTIGITIENNDFNTDIVQCLEEYLGRALK